MKIRVFLLTAALAAFGWVRLPATTSLMPVEEIKPGMVGTGRTIFEGSELKEFKVHILGVLKNVQAPQRNLILARLEGGPLAETGVIAGMSGSPVYIDGRLVGAVSYSIGAFPKEPIAGITPIGEMIEATADTGGRRGSGPQARVELPVTPERLAAAIRANYARVAMFADRPADVQAFGVPASSGSQMGALLRPIATPLVLSGMDAATSDLVGSMFRDAGFTPMFSGGSGGDVATETGPLRPGDPVGVSLLGGDGEMGATGTITHVDGDRLYAFGHPFFNFGPTAFPLTRAHVYATLPSLMSSFKIATMGEVIGTMNQDRATAIAGTLDKGPAVIPITITLDNGRAATRTFRYTAVNDQLFTPLLTYVALFNTLGNYERQFGAMTFTVKGKATFDTHADLDYEDIFTGDGTIAAAAAYVAGPVTMLLANDVEKVTLKGVELAVTTSEESRSATIERVWLDEVRPRAGRTVPLKVLTRTYRGAEKISTIPIEIPANAVGQLTVMVTDGRQLNQIEQRELRRSVQPTSVAQMIKVMNQSHRNNRVYVRLLTGTPGAVVNGEALTSLPPSVLAVLEGDRSGGSFTPIRSAALGEWELAMDSAISGTRVLTIDLDGRPGRH
ncbi:MAG TPA: SpoIVB peptidase S55 domain-containing protein [Vicinamibacterales bacterium]|nr:SpoIVB peptidase S55 domain-containing protein [Vicinamibacterales bacterium]